MASWFSRREARSPSRTVAWTHVWIIQKPTANRSEKGIKQTRKARVRKRMLHASHTIHGVTLRRGFLFRLVADGNEEVGDGVVSGRYNDCLAEEAGGLVPGD